MLQSKPGSGGEATGAVLAEPKLLQGNEACAEAALAAGCRFYGGYPITPSSEIAEIMARRLPPLGGVFVQMEDEIASICSCIGASLGGVKAMSATSGPGFSLMQENIGYASLTETPVVIINVQRVGPSTGMPTLPAQGDIMQARWGTHGDHPVVVLVPASVAETYQLTFAAFNISEALRVPVILLSDEVVAHMRELVRMQPPAVIDRPRPTTPEGFKPFAPGPDLVPPMAAPGQGYRFHTTGLMHREDGGVTNEPKDAGALLHRLQDKLSVNREAITLYATHDLDDAEVAVFAYGSPARAALRAVRELRLAGVKAGLFQAQTVWPFPAPEVAALASRVRAILVPEMNLGQLVGEVERAAAGRCRVVPLAKVGGELFTPAEIRVALEVL